METASKNYIIQTVYKTNILPIISECNTSCIFCSHKQNPEGVEVFRLPKMNFEALAEIITFLSPDKKIVIGESATRIIEGEPLLHKDFLNILKLIRSKFKKTIVQVTTNGMLLSKELIDELINIGGVELNISVNCVNPLKRKTVLGLKSDNSIIEKIHMLSGRIKFSGSCVVVPEIMGDEDLEEFIALMDGCGAETVRIFLPGYTFLSKRQEDFTTLYNTTKKLVNSLRKKYLIPIILEPSIINGLEARIEGIVKSTAASIAGLQEGDIITEINNEKVKTRVDAFNLAFRLKNPVLKVLRGFEELTITVQKAKNASPGFTVLYDMDPDIVETFERAASRYKAGNVLLITSELAYEVMCSILSESEKTAKYEIAAAKNSFFGGTIKCAGLLTVQDILDTLEQHLRTNKEPDLILLPPIMFDSNKNDLLGRNIKEITQKLKISADIP